MKSNKIIALTAAMAVAVLTSGAVQAAGIGARVGTTGIGGDIGWKVMPTLSARIGYSKYDFSADMTKTDVRYDGEVKLSNLSALLDWSPLGPFRITAGLVGTNNRLNLTATPTGGTYTINGTSYDSSTEVGSLTGTVKAGNSVSPYLGIGYGNVAGVGVNFYADLGVIYQGSPKASLSASCGTALDATQCSTLQSNVAAESYRLEDKLSSYKYLPVANIGITIGF